MAMVPASFKVLGGTGAPREEGIQDLNDKEKFFRAVLQKNCNRDAK